MVKTEKILVQVAGTFVLLIAGIFFLNLALTSLEKEQEIHTKNNIEWQTTYSR